MEAVRIRGIAAGGDGVGTLADGRAVFIPRTAPGDLVEPAALVLSQRFARARVGRLLERAPERTDPGCGHYDGDDCGGCQLQHLSSSAQRAARRGIVADALTRIGKCAVPVSEPEPALAEWGYRTKVTLAVKRGRIGYHRTGQPNEVFDLRRCDIARPELNALWGVVSAARGLLPRTAARLVLRADRAGSVHLLVHDAGERAWTGAAALSKALAAAGHHPVVWWVPPQGAPRAVAGAPSAYPATVFEQIHPVMGDRVRAHAVEALGPVAGRHVWDLYAGIGETTARLRAGGATVESVEVDRRAVEVAARRAGTDAGVVRHVGRVEDRLARLHPAAVAVVNPPRTGLGEAVAGFLAAAPLDRLVYVSCDPATLARDLGRMAVRYAIAAVRPFDLFPQTAHVETVVRLEPR